MKILLPIVHRPTSHHHFDTLAHLELFYLFRNFTKICFPHKYYYFNPCLWSTFTFPGRNLWVKRQPPKNLDFPIVHFHHKNSFFVLDLISCSFLYSDKFTICIILFRLWGIWSQQTVCTAAGGGSSAEIYAPLSPSSDKMFLFFSYHCHPQTGGMSNQIRLFISPAIAHIRHQSINYVRSRSSIALLIV